MFFVNISDIGLSYGFDTLKKVGVIRTTIGDKNNTHSIGLYNNRDFLCMAGSVVM